MLPQLTSVIICTFITTSTSKANLKAWRNNFVSLLSFCSIQTIAVPYISLPFAQEAQAKQQIEVDPTDLTRLKRGLKEVNYLLDHWDEKTVYCNFGEFKRELLLPENKQELMKAAASTGLLDYDKSATMNVMCRSDPEVVRAFLGLTQENLLLAKAEDLMRRPSSIGRVDEDSLEEYLSAVEDFSVAVSNVNSLGYTARTDFGSTETQTLEQIKAGGGSKKLRQTKADVIQARDSLTKVVGLLHLDDL